VLKIDIDEVSEENMKRTFNPQPSRTSRTPRLAFLAAATLLLVLAVLLLGPTQQPAKAFPNLPPYVWTDNPSVVVEEGQTATNSGTVEQLEEDGGVGPNRLTASEGTVTQPDAYGRWSWSMATADVPADETKTVTITATDSGGLSGKSSFSLTVKDIDPPPPPPPVNDNFVDSEAIGSAAASVSGTTQSATREESEPNHYGPQYASQYLVGDHTLSYSSMAPPAPESHGGEHTVWYSWKAQASGSTTIDTCQANINSILAVYTGGELKNLSPVANDWYHCDGYSGGKVTFNASANTTYHIVVGNQSGLQEGAFTLKVSPPPNTQAPKVTSTVPAANATGVAPGVDVTATFSEAMMTSSINATTFKLFKGTTAIGAVVSYDPITKKATLNPNAHLQRGAKYKAVVSTGATDAAGNALDQDAATSGSQPKQWVFTVRR
jgi:hypothetical protein